MRHDQEDSFALLYNFSCYFIYFQACCV